MGLLICDCDRGHHGGSLLKRLVERLWFWLHPEDRPE